MSKGRGEDRMEAYLRKHLLRAAQDAKVELTYHPQRSDPYNKSPDFIVDVKVRIELLPQCPLIIRFPLLVEVEAGAGFNGGLEDLHRFVERCIQGVDPLGPRIELPFLIATEVEDGRTRDLEVSLPITIRAKEISIPNVE
jgi:hypothetical protein